MYFHTGFSEITISLTGNVGERSQLLLYIGLHKLHEGAAQPNGGSADTLVYGNRHRGFHIRALNFFFMVEAEGKKSCV